jgi:Family of unknown function (DUF5819)
MLILTATIAHAALVFLYNSPSNALKTAASYALEVYNGPQLDQGWVLFAPDISKENLHVLARAKLSNGRVTSWYDVTLFFLEEMHRNRLTATRSLSEGLAHAVPFADAREYRRRAIARGIVLQTAAMVLKLYNANVRTTALQIEIDEHEIPELGTSPKRLAATRRASWPWGPMPETQLLPL